MPVGAEKKRLKSSQNVVAKRPGFEGPVYIGLSKIDLHVKLVFDKISANNG